MNGCVGSHIQITGVVQGVGFRPFVYSLARELNLNGWVRNTSGGVDIEVEGSSQAIESFLSSLVEKAPPLARIDSVEAEERPVNGFTAFEIHPSQPQPDAFQPISPDVSICPDCLKELFDPHDRRYRYPFINCTNCGPRFTIIADIPYDRPKTTMAGFPMCAACENEYRDPLNRRFHAQPVACPDCGPSIWLENSRNPTHTADRDAALIAAQKMLADGKIVAVKGLGGFHLACDATNQHAVMELRQRKLRVDKPFALMMPDIETVEKHCILDDAERELLESRPRPIVILQRRYASIICKEVAPGQNTIGVMLPYTPLHYLLFSRPPVDDSDFDPVQALVMTSGNLSEEPIATNNEDARQRLAQLADAFLMHNRPIRTRCDDSVMRVIHSSHTSQASPAKQIPIRRSRGYAPYPVRLNRAFPPLLAVGAELKNTFCLLRDRYAFMSHHIGDLENFETLQSFEDSISHFERLFRISPQALAYDLHPNYLATRYALQRAEENSLPAIGIQHHHAHIAACMAEHDLYGEQPVIGVAFDGTGYGTDGAIWGGEFLLVSDRGFQRAAHLDYVPLPGGDAAVRKPARMALAYLWKYGLDWEPDYPCVSAFCAEERSALRTQIEHGLNAPLTSSMGRFFDAAASLAGVRQKVNYEAQAAIELEALVDPQEMGQYPMEAREDVSGQIIIDPSPTLFGMIHDFAYGVSPNSIAARFHHGIAHMVLEVCQLIRQQTGTNLVVLSGGVWQNVTLLQDALHLLTQAKFVPYFHSLVPTNDGGLALGQALIAARLLENMK